MRTESVLKRGVHRIPLVGPALRGAARLARQRAFPGSGPYWERHYARGGHSGEGSGGRLAEFKAEVLNGLVAAHDIGSVIEFGCGDGRQLALARYPRYLGLDVSPTTLRRTAASFADDPTKGFLCYDPTAFADPAGYLTAELALSLDVIYHLVEDEVYERHLRHVFGAGSRLVVLFTSDADRLPGTPRSAPHVRHRPVVRDVAERFTRWRLRERIANRYPYQGAHTPTSFADFLVYEPVADPDRR
jgi:SAM-dependent methyltransferase